LLLSLADRACAQGTAFTYQGRFAENGVAANGTVEFQFTLWNALNSGTQVATATPASSIVNVTNGLFTTPIDFGATAFDGADRYLQIEARTTIGPFVTLTPRQRITAAPYALLAGNLSGSLTSGSLMGTYGNALTFSNAANVFVGNGAGLTSLNASQLTGALPASVLSNAWKINGNAGTTAGMNFLGTTDNQPLELKANGQRTLRLEPISATNISPGFSQIFSNVPNVIGGASGNVVDAGVFGSFVGGGGVGSYYYNTGTVYYLYGSLPNRISANFSTIAGGYLNIIQTNAENSAIGGGAANTIQTHSGDGVIGGGSGNTMTNAYAATIGGGYHNTIETVGNFTTIAGGVDNTIAAGAPSATVGGGSGNTNRASTGVIGGGSRNLIGSNGYGATISGGNQNTADGQYAAVAGGNHNTADDYYATVGGGSQNNSSDYYATVGGGLQNTSDRIATTVGGGFQNTSSAPYATVPGGFSNNAAGLYSFAAGRNAKALHHGAFVWADNTAADFGSTANNQFLIRAGGGVGIGTATTPPGGLRVHTGGLAVTGASSPNYGTSGGVYIEYGSPYGQIYAFDYGTFIGKSLILNGPGGSVGVGRIPTGPGNAFEVEGGAGKTVAGNWSANSDARIKTDVRTVTHALEKLAQVRPVEFRYTKEYRAQHPSIEDRPYLNVIAQEFQKVFPEAVQSSGDKLPNGEAILQVDTYPLTIYSAAAIQELNQKVEEQRGELKQKQTEITELKQRMEKLERLMNQKNGGAK
jgi:hypothetical protein